jgi:hypothetical protein
MAVVVDRVVLDRPTVVRTVALKDSTGAPLTGRLLAFDGGELLFTTLDQPAVQSPSSGVCSADKQKVGPRRVSARPRGSESSDLPARQADYPARSLPSSSEAVSRSHTIERNDMLTTPTGADRILATVANAEAGE